MFANGAYAHLWEIKRISEKYSDVRISTSKKQDDGTYKDDFSGFVRMIGKAHKALDYIHESESFRIISCGVESRYDKETKKTFTNFLIFDAEPSDNKKADADLKPADDNPFL